MHQQQNHKWIKMNTTIADLTINTHKFDGKMMKIALKFGWNLSECTSLDKHL